MEIFNNINFDRQEGELTKISVDACKKSLIKFSLSSSLFKLSQRPISGSKHACLGKKPSFVGPKKRLVEACLKCCVSGGPLVSQGSECHRQLS